MPNKEKWTGILHFQRIGYQPANQIHNRQWLTSNFNTKTTVQQNNTIEPIGTEYRDVNDKRTKFEGKTTAPVEINGKRNDLEVLRTTEKTNPPLGLDWMEKMGKNLSTGKTGPQINHVIEDPDITDLKERFKKRFNENHIVNGLEVKIQLREDAKLLQQKGRPIPIHLKKSVGKEINKLFKQGHIEKANNIDQN